MHHKHVEPLLLTLCPVCASQFYASADHWVERTNEFQAVKEECTYCGVRRGYDYFVTPKRPKARTLHFPHISSERRACHDNCMCAIS